MVTGTTNQEKKKHPVHWSSIVVHRALRYINDIAKGNVGMWQKMVAAREQAIIISAIIIFNFIKCNLFFTFL